MDESKIIEAIETIEGSVSQYVEIMKMFSSLNVAEDDYFKTKFNGYYRVRQRSKEWYQSYYSYMESHKGLMVSFRDVLSYMKMHTNRYEPSFSSKLLATHNPNMPIWDKQVLRSLKMEAPNSYSKNRLEDSVALYNRICTWYSEQMNTPLCRFIINKFDERYTNYNSVSDVKKIDFVLWRLGT
ncbi:MAG: hypothetical protein Q8K40_07480 [Ignavibacteria bacterium]|nr:hypothetical protein [Ignavibacteria bacterium]